jgi:hypothetical protein
MEAYGSGWVAIAAVVDDEDESITDAAWFHELPEELFERAYLGRWWNRPRRPGSRQGGVRSAQ